VVAAWSLSLLYAVTYSVVFGVQNKSAVSVIGRAALAVAKGFTRKVDVIHVQSATEEVFALSVFGWGLAGAVALKADKLRWLPGQRSARYDIAGFVTMIQVGAWVAVV
jgi:hypothetical protein